MDHREEIEKLKQQYCLCMREVLKRNADSIIRSANSTNRDEIVEHINRQVIEIGKNYLHNSFGIYDDLLRSRDKERIRQIALDTGYTGEDAIVYDLCYDDFFSD